MEERLLKRADQEGRHDDNHESIRRRFKTFQDQTVPVIDLYDRTEPSVRVVKVALPPKPIPHFV